MTTFKQFLQLSESVYVPQEVKAEHFIAWCEEHAPKYMQNIRTAAIYRGMDAPDMGYIDTNLFNRTSANTRNYYTIWMDNNPEWKDYPKRSKALICSTNEGTAGGFGTVQLIIPADSNKIGRCDENDLWGAFPFLAARLDSKMESMDDFISNTHHLFKIADVDTVSAEKNYDDLIYALKKVTRQTVEEWVDGTGSFDSKQYAKAFDKHGYKTLYDLWADCMDPDENDFQVFTAATFKSENRDVEIWVQGPCQTIDHNFFQNQIKDHDSPFFEFGRKYQLHNIR